MFSSPVVERLDEKSLQTLTTQWVLTNVEDHRLTRSLSQGLFDLDEKPGPLKVGNVPIVWGTDDYAELGDGYSFSDALHDVRRIVPRTAKSKKDQQRRVKAKAEVFTPTWVCNVQNNLVDENGVHPLVFNRVSDDQKTWTATERIEFTDEYPWYSFVASRRLEMCCGEGPYLFSRYDASTGKTIPLKDANGNFHRIGILDRKLRVIAENVDTVDDWLKAASCALRSTYGFEWQGDNLYIARLNMVSTFFEYLEDFAFGKGLESSVVEGLFRDVQHEVCTITAQQLWQMDGLKFVLPGSCSSSCKSCAKKLRTGHEGVASVLRWGGEWRVFEDFVDRRG